MSASTSAILERGARLLIGPILVVALYLLFAGHNAPGGGFVGGLTAGLALSLGYAADGPAAIRRITRLAPTTLLGAGLAVAGLTGAAGWVFGGGFLDAGAATWEIPLLGPVKATSALMFDTGVFVVVAGMVGLTLEGLSGREDA